MDNKRHMTAIILAAGQGKRMQSSIPKQYLHIMGKPILFYTIEQFERSFIDDIILVVGKDETEYCKKEIVEKYQFKKVSAIVEGGRERYHSVYKGLMAAETSDYVFIHDGARPFVDQQILQRIRESVQKSNACVAGMPVKDTIKIVDENGQVTTTPNRKYVWAVQTPQAFSYDLIKKAYEMIIEKEDKTITDDAMVVEKTMGYPVVLVEGSYRNIKITTPEDILIAECYLKEHIEKAEEEKE